MPRRERNLILFLFLFSFCVPLPRSRDERNGRVAHKMEKEKTRNTALRSHLSWMGPSFFPFFLLAHPRCVQPQACSCKRLFVPLLWGCTRSVLPRSGDRRSVLRTSNILTDHRVTVVYWGTYPGPVILLLVFYFWQAHHINIKKKEKEVTGGPCQMKRLREYRGPGHCCHHFFVHAWPISPYFLFSVMWSGMP